MAKTTSDSVQPTEVNGQAVEAPEEQVVPEPKQVSKDEVEIELFHQFINSYSEEEARALGIKLDAPGKQIFGPGKVTVDRATADDLLRRQAAVLKSEHDRVTPHDLSSGRLGHLG